MPRTSTVLNQTEMVQIVLPLMPSLILIVVIIVVIISPPPLSLPPSPSVKTARGSREKEYEIQPRTQINCESKNKQRMKELSVTNQPTTSIQTSK